MKLQATLYIPEDEEDFHIDIYDKQLPDYQIAEIFRKGDKTIIDINEKEIYNLWKTPLYRAICSIVWDFPL